MIHPDTAASLIALQRSLEVLSKHWFKRWFLPSSFFRALKRYHEAPDNIKLLQVCKAFDNTWFFQRWFFSCLSKFKTSYFMQGYATLKNTGLLKGEHAETNFNAVAGHQSPACIAYALYTLHKSGLLSGEHAQANRDVLAEHQNLWALTSALEILDEAGLLRGEAAQTCFDSLIAHSAILFGNHIVRLEWMILTFNLLTQAHFDAIIQICIAYQAHIEVGRTAFVNYVDRQILNIQPGNALNAHQSTHTASVHVGTDLTAWFLSRKYASLGAARSPDFNPLLASLKKFKAELLKLKKDTPNAPILDPSKIDVAIRCIERLSQTPAHIEISKEKKETCLSLAHTLEFKGDEKEVLISELKKDRKQDSVFTLNQFLHWLILEIQDKPNSLEALVEGLYEIQRGYNLDAHGREKNGGTDSDLPICYGGTANKFCERLQGLSPLIVFVFITKETLNLKLKQLVIEGMIQHCNTLLTQAKGGDAVAKERLIALTLQLKNAEQAGECFEALYQDQENAFSNQLKEAFPSQSDKDLSDICTTFKENSLPYCPAILAEHKAFYGEEKFSAFETLFKESEALPKPPVEALPSQNGLFATTMLSQNHRSLDEAQRNQGVPFPK